MSTEKINVPVTVPSLATPDHAICVTSNAIVWMETMKRMISAVSLIFPNHDPSDASISTNVVKPFKH